MPRRHAAALAVGFSTILLSACNPPTGVNVGFTLTATPTVLTLSQGQSGISTLKLARSRGFSGAVTLGIIDPDGITISVRPRILTGTDTSAALGVSVAATTAPGEYTAVFEGTGPNSTRSLASLVVTVTAAGAVSLSLALTPNTLTIPQGQIRTSTLTITRTGFTGQLSLSATGAPTDMIVALVNGVSATRDTVTFDVIVGRAVATGNHTVTVHGTTFPGGGLTATTMLIVIVTAPPPPSIALAVTPTAGTLQAGGPPGTANLTITRINFAGAVALTDSGAPAGLTVTFNPASVSGVTSAITIAVGASVAAGTYPVTLKGAGTGIATATTVLTITVAAAAGSIALTTNPATLSVQQGTSGTANLTITRNNFTGPVNLTSSGAPPGVAVSFNPAATTGTMSTVTVAVGASAAPGSYQITLQGAGAGIANASVTLSLTVTAPSGGITTWTFCAQSGLPLWFAYQNFGGSWTQVVGAANVYSFNITTRGAVAWVMPDGAKTRLEVYYGSQQDLAARGSGMCRGNGSVKTINATLRDVGQTGSATITMGAGVLSVTGGGTRTLPIMNVQDGFVDLIGVTPSPPSTVSLIVIKRDQNIASGGNVTVDFDPAGGGGVVPITRTATIANLQSQQALFSAALLTKNATSATLYFDTPGTSLTRTWRAVPDATTVSGDFHTQTVIATNAGSTSGTPSRAVTYYSRLATNQTLSLPDAITTLPTVTVAGTSPYVTLNSNWVIQSAQYNQVWTMTFVPSSGSVSQAIVSGTAGYFSSGPVQLAIPIFGAGFNPMHGLQPGIPITWTFFAAGGAVYSSGPAEGALGTFATVGGSFTP